MEDLLLILIFCILLVFIFFITRLLTVLFHELGHAIPIILMTRQLASIYIGSYGDPEKSLYFSLGLLDVYIKYDPLSWEYGLCVTSAKKISINKEIIYTLAGPLASLVVAVIVSYIIFTYDFNNFSKLIFVILIGSSVFDFFGNIVPKTTPIKLYNGNLTYNDGYQLKLLFHYKKYPKEYEQACGLYNEQKFAEAATLFNDLLKGGLKEQQICRLAVSSFLQVKNYQQAKEILDEFILQDKMNSDDFADAGIPYSHLSYHDKALELYEKSLELNPNNKYSLNNKGFTLNLLNRFEDAVHCFDKAIEIDKMFAHSYSNRGLAKIKTGKQEEGLEDITHSLKLDEKNSYSYCNLGIYHLDKGEYPNALSMFKKAKELDNTTYKIEELIIEAQNKELKNNNQK